MFLFDRTVRHTDLAARLGGGVRCWTLGPGLPPLFIEPGGLELEDSAAFAGWVAQTRPVLDALIVEHGGIVLRGFPMTTTEDLNRVAGAFPAYEGGYQGGNAPRRKLAGRVYEATQLAGPHRLMLHQEMYYADDPPAWIAFFARIVADEGGETTIGDMRRLTREMPASIRAKLEAKGVRNIRNFAAATGVASETEHADRRGWDFAFYTDSKDEVEDVCRRRRWTPIWNPDGSLTVINDLAAFTTHPVTGERVYRAGIHGFGANGHRRQRPAPDSLAAQVRASQVNPTGICLGDGTDFDAEEERALLQLVDDVTVVWPWQAGDLMILDNLQVAHGRNPYVGERATEVAMFR